MSVDRHTWTQNTNQFSQNTLGGQNDDAGEEGLACLSREVEKGEAKLQS